MAKQLKDDDPDNIPLMARRCWQRYQQATEDQRKREKESIGFWIGGDLQWYPGECDQRRANNRPIVSINRCGPAVDQVECDARNNPMGPDARPMGDGADKDGAGKMEGLIREYEFRSNATEAAITAFRQALAGGSGCWELATEYVSGRSMEQQLVVKPIHDQSTVFYDPDAYLPAREDAMWAGKIRKLSRDQLTEEFPGASLKILDRNAFQAAGDYVTGWMADALKWQNDSSTLSQWSGGIKGEGPYFVCTFWRVKIEKRKLQMWSDNILRYEDEEPPAGVTVKMDDAEKKIQRWSPQRIVTKYVVTALDEIDSTEWEGDIIPLFWVMGPEIRLDGKLYRKSLLSGSQDAQRLLNYTSTSMAEITGSMNKSPFVGFQGQFDVVNAQGERPWEAGASKLYPYLEVVPVFATDEQGVHHMLPLPQRNTWEAPIDRLMALATFAAENIKAATSVFFEPSIRSAQAVQSGEAIKALQAQSNAGTSGWHAALKYAKMIEYNQAGKILAKLHGPVGSRKKTIIRADGQHEVADVDASIGRFAYQVGVGTAFRDRAQKAVSTLTDIFKIVPQILTMPAVAARFIRLVGEGQPEVEAMADSIQPPTDAGQNPEQALRQVQQLQAENVKLKGVLQQMQQAIQMKLPEIEAKKWIAALNAIAGIREDEIKSGSDQAASDTDALEHLTGLAHEVGIQATEHAHQQRMQQAGAEQDQQAQTADQEHAAEMQDSQQQAAEKQASAQPTEGE